MRREGKYVYCVIETEQERNFGPMGVGARGDEVLTIGYDDLSMVVSNYPIAGCTASRENLIAHQVVIERMMNEFDSVLPVRFGTIASGADEVRNLLDRRRREFKDRLAAMDHKVELGVKAFWRDMHAVYDELLRENSSLKRRKEALRRSGRADPKERIEIGRLVKESLEEKRQADAEELVDRLRRSSYDYRLNKTIGDEMFMNAAFLVGRGREREFDNVMDDLSEEHEGTVRFLYSGPLPVFNFVDIVIYPEEWEK
jgi:hypothetical protein